MELRLFSQLRRFFRSKKPGGGGFPIDLSKSCVIEISHEERVEDTAINLEDDKDDRDASAVVSLQSAVKRLHFGGEAEKESAAMAIGKLAREDPKVKGLLGELGVVEALVNMLDHDDHEGSNRRTAALGALHELSRFEIHMFKFQMMEARILMRLPKDIQQLDQGTLHEFSDIILQLSLTKNAHLGPQESENVVEFTLCVLESNAKYETKVSVLGAMYRYSEMLENAVRLTEDRVVDSLLRLSSSSEQDLSEKALSILGNLVVTSQGKKALESSPIVPENLIDILTWETKPKCQELSAYILMILAHQSATQRAKMAKSGIVQVLLELALLGRSTLVQKRALKLLQWFKDERGAKVGPHSGPQGEVRRPFGSPVGNRGEEAREGRMMMEKLVKESLHRNMEVITRRANHGDAGCECDQGIKALVISTSSKSLPY